MGRLFRNWGTVRWIRLGLASVLLMAGITSGDAMAYAAAAFFGLQALLDFGCCGAACTTDSRTDKQADGTNVVYEEVK